MISEPRQDTGAQIRVVRALFFDRSKRLLSHLRGIIRAGIGGQLRLPQIRHIYHATPVGTHDGTQLIDDTNVRRTHCALVEHQHIHNASIGGMQPDLGGQSILTFLRDIDARAHADALPGGRRRQITIRHRRTDTAGCCGTAQVLLGQDADRVVLFEGPHKGVEFLLARRRRLFVHGRPQRRVVQGLPQRRFRGLEQLTNR